MADSKQQKPANKRGAARLAAVQALYQMEITGAGLQDVITEYESLRLGREVDGEEYLAADVDWFRATVSGVIKQQKSIDPVIHASLPKGWPLPRLEVLLRAILRSGVFELMHHKDVPGAVIVNEYVDIAKAFFDRDEWRMVNALLDNVARQHNAEDTSLKVRDASQVEDTAPTESTPSEGSDER